MSESNSETIKDSLSFSGNIFIFQAFDIGDDINLEGIKKAQKLLTRPQTVHKYFKNYHTPLAVELPHPNSSGKCISTKIHHFGAISLVYQISFESTLEDLREEINSIDNTYKEQSVIDAKSLFNTIKKYIYQPSFFQHRTSYLTIQVDPQPNKINAAQLKKQYGGIIASMLKLEDVQLSESQKEETFEGDIGYYREELALIDSECSFVYDPEYRELLNFFEFANIQQLELQFFDKLLDEQLNIFYERKLPTVPPSAYIPFVGIRSSEPIGELDKLRVDISVITERLENSIKLSGEPYYAELYEIIEKKLDIKAWKESIERKLAIIRDIKTVYNDKINTVREHVLETLIIILIFIELIIGIIK